MRCLVGLLAHHAVSPDDMGRDASESNGGILDTVGRINSKQGLVFARVTARAVTPRLLLDGLSSALIIARHMDVNSMCRLEHAATQLTLVPRYSCVKAQGRGRDCLVPARRSC